MSTIVVVTYDNDNWWFEMLCKSIFKYLEPCKFLVVYNGDTFDLWYKFFDYCNKNYLKDFDVTLKTKDTYLSGTYNYGYIDQQIIKLEVSKDINTDCYVILDSKNFFFRNCKIENIKNENHRENFIIGPNYKNFCIATAKIFGIKWLAFQRQPLTPYVMQTDIVRKICQQVDLYSHFYKYNKLPKYIPDNFLNKESVSEFSLYEIYCQKIGFIEEEVKQNNCTEAVGSINEEKWFNVQSEDIYVCGLHRTLLESWRQKDVIKVLETLQCVDILPTYSDNPFSA